MTTMRRQAKTMVNSVLGTLNLELKRTNVRSEDYRDYIPFQYTIDEANKANMSVGDYVDAQYNVPGSTQSTMDQMAALGVFADPIDRVCEIGPGTGRYLKELVTRCSPKYYEIYETSAEWRTWLAANYAVTTRPTDGMSLSATPDCSIDLVHTHKVMPGQPSLVICRYYLEMIRVLREGGKVVFDIVTEECLRDDILTGWLRSEVGYQHYPCLMPKQFTIDFFASRNVDFVGSFLVPMLPGETECMVFKKESGMTTR